MDASSGRCQLPAGLPARLLIMVDLYQIVALCGVLTAVRHDRSASANGAVAAADHEVALVKFACDAEPADRSERCYGTCMTVCYRDMLDLFGLGALAEDVEPGDGGVGWCRGGA
jgi:hypothetical protein